MPSPALSSEPVAAANVANRSGEIAGCSKAVPAGRCAGHLKRKCTRMPPSRWKRVLPLSGPFEPRSWPRLRTQPLWTRRRSKCSRPGREQGTRQRRHRNSRLPRRLWRRGFTVRLLRWGGSGRCTSVVSCRGRCGALGVSMGGNRSSLRHRIKPTACCANTPVRYSSASPSFEAVKNRAAGWTLGRRVRPHALPRRGRPGPDPQAPGTASGSVHVQRIRLGGEPRQVGEPNRLGSGQFG